MSLRSNRWLPLAGLAALVVLNVVLIALLLTRPNSPPMTEERTPAPSGTDSAFAPEDLTTPPEKEEPAELTEVEDTAALSPSNRIIANADAMSAWRATVGDCTSPGVLEYSTDQGQTWQELSLDLAPVSRLRVLGPETLFAIGGGAECEPTYISSSTAGNSWLSNEQFLNGSWYLMPADPSILATPVGEVNTPCQAVELAALDARNGALLCADGTLAITQDGGASWSSEEDVELAVGAIGVATDGYALAGVADACGESLAVVAADVAGNVRGELTCTEATASDLNDVAISAIAGAVWLWAGDQVLVLDGA